ncbi:MAG TPA: ATP-binding cassette domain-containing protein, partial [Anaerolineae bacterium]|nr:ATP-binding cassette domain-containing protein [Anaerolineae bacterium]
QLAGSVQTSETTPAEMARMMVGRTTFGMPSLDEASSTQPAARAVLRLDGVTAVDNKGLPALKGITLDVYGGEIMGLAGVSGNGQSELAQVLEGTRLCTTGTITVAGQDVSGADPDRIMKAGVGRIPEDRHASVVPEMTVAQNMALEHLGEYTSNGSLNRRQMRAHAEKLIAEYQIKARPDDRIRTLSGGNMQKVILARVMERNPKVIIVSQPTRGLDIGATEYVRSRLLEQRQRGAAILLISEDLDEILELSDRVAVIYEGEIQGILPRTEADPERLGLMMAGAKDSPQWA